MRRLYSTLPILLLDAALIVVAVSQHPSPRW
jgi:hypothetical protein